MKQIGTALLMYVQDYDEQFPSGSKLGYPNGPSNPNPFVYGEGWGGQIYPYSKNAQILKCPDDSTPNVNAQGGVEALFPNSYIFNRNIALNPADASLNAPATTVGLAEVKNVQADVTATDEVGTSNKFPPQFSSAGDGLFYLASTIGTSTNGVLGSSTQGAAVYETGTMGGYSCNGTGKAAFNCNLYDSSNNYQGRHTAGANYFLADGHAKYLKGAAVSPGGNAQASTNVEDQVNGYAAGTASSGFSVTFSTN
jgi:prepilin-type processing-associated H-X9-DG protein